MSIKTAKLAILITGAAIFGVGGTAAAMMYRKADSSSATGALSAPGSAAGSAESSSTNMKVVATVGSARLTEADINAAGGGAERPVVVDRLISQVVAASLADHEFNEEARVAAERAKREVLSAMYLQRKSQALRAALTEPQIKAFYDSELSASQFTAYKTSYVVANDVAALNPIVEAITSGKADQVASKFSAVKSDGDGYARANELPLGIGQLMKSLKAGDYSKPIMLRNGVFIFRLDAVRDNPKPPIEAVSESIKDLLVARQLDATLQQARKEVGIRIM